MALNHYNNTWPQCTHDRGPSTRYVLSRCQRARLLLTPGARGPDNHARARLPIHAAYMANRQVRELNAQLYASAFRFVSARSNGTRDIAVLAHQTPIVFPTPHTHQRRCAPVHRGCIYRLIDKLYNRAGPSVFFCMVGIGLFSSFSNLFAVGRADRPFTLQVLLPQFNIVITYTRIYTARRLQCVFVE